MPTGIDLIMFGVSGGQVEAEPRNALDYLQDVYRGRRQADSQRMRAAMAALQFETPRLGVIATTNLNEQDFARLLDRAIERSNRVARPKQIEHRPFDPSGDAGPAPQVDVNDEKQPGPAQRRYGQVDPPG
jgi:hypothetical protein